MTEDSLFERVVKLPDDERPAFLDRECAGDRSLRARIEAQMAPTAKEDAAFEAATGQYVAATGSFHSDVPDRVPGVEAEGAVVAGRYRLLKPIGEGGMGTVWQAEQTEPVRRMVALKLIRVDRGLSGTILARFDAERQAIARMDHPHIAKLFDAGRTEGGSPFFVMELVEGCPLNEFCDRNRLSIPDRLNLFVQICSAVQHAHQKGIIHRDLKPGNILVETIDGKPVPKVIDFGLAKATTGLPLTDQSLATAFGSILGTPLYMAPEQADAQSVDIDTRADVYSLGVILYELLTGTTPLTRETLRKAAFDEILRLVREQEAVTPSSRLSSSEVKPSVAANRQIEPQQLGRLLKGELDWIVLKALSKDRDRRYETPGGFARDLERFLNHEPVQAGPVGAGYRLRKFVRRNRVQVTAASLVLLTLVAGIAGTSIGLVKANAARKAEQLRADGEEEAKNAEREAKEAAVRDKRIAENTRMFFVKILSRSASISLDGSTTNPRITVREAVEHARTILAKDFRDDPEGEADIRVCLGSIFLSQGENEKGKAEFDAARAIYKRLFGEESPKYLLALSNDTLLAANPTGQSPELESVMAKLRDQAAQSGDHREILQIYSSMMAGTLAQRLGDFEAGERAFGAALETAQAKYDADHELVLVLRVAIANCLIQRSKSAEARREFLEIRTAALKKYGGPSFSSIACDLGLGMVAFSTSKADSAEFGKPFLAAVEASEKLNLKHLPHLIPAHIGLARYYWDSNEDELALKHVNQAERLAVGMPDVLKRTVACVKAITLLRLKRYAEAEQLFEPLYAGKEIHADLKTLHDDICNGYLLTLVGLKKLALAEPVCKQYVENREKSPKVTLAMMTKDRLTHLMILIGLNRVADVRAIRDRIVQDCRKLDPLEWAKTLDGLRNLGLQAARESKRDIAVEIHTEVHRFRKEKLTVNHNETAVSAGDLAHALGEIGRNEGREQLYREAMTGTMAALGADHENTRLCANNLADFFRRAGKLQEATAVHVALADAVAKAKGPSSDVARKRAWQAIDYCKELGRHADAVPVARKLIDAMTAVTGEGDHERTNARLVLGQCLLVSGQTREAVEVLSLSLTEGRIKSAGTTAFAVNQTWLAEAMIGEKRYAEAERLLLEAYPKLLAAPKTLMETPPDRAVEQLILLYTLLNRPEDLKKWQSERSKFARTIVDDGSVATLPGLIAASVAKPSDTFLTIKLATLQAWHGMPAELAETQARAIRSATGSNDPATLERTAKACLLLPTGTPARYATALELARRASDLGKDHPLRHYFWMAQGIAEYRCGRFAEADATLTKAAFTDPVNEHVYLTSAFFRAMSLYRAGRVDEAQKIHQTATAKMKPMPKDPDKPLAGAFSADDLIVFLASREASALVRPAKK